jgi:peptidylprolyl isomerase
MSAISRRKARFAPPILLPALAAVLSVLTVTACSSTSGSSSGGKAEKAESAAAASAAQSTLPAVTNATNLQAKPSIAAGKPPAPTTLKTQDLVVGSGAVASSPAQTVSVRYVGVNYADGKEFDSSWSDASNQPATFQLSGVIQGFGEGIIGMKVGGRRLMVIPPSLGYGAQGQPPAVGPNETLVFVVDLVKVS